ncbi:MAG: hypothetical protein ACTSP4_13700 [Candidatus Hodarchaeales archaeon]
MSKDGLFLFISLICLITTIAILPGSANGNYQLIWRTNHGSKLRITISPSQPVFNPEQITRFVVTLEAVKFAPEQEKFTLISIKLRLNISSQTIYSEIVRYGGLLDGLALEHEGAMAILEIQLLFPQSDALSLGTQVENGTLQYYLKWSESESFISHSYSSDWTTFGTGIINNTAISQTDTAISPLCESLLALIITSQIGYKKKKK